MSEPDSEELSCRPSRAVIYTCAPLSVRRSVFVLASSGHLAAAARCRPSQTLCLNNIDKSYLNNSAVDHMRSAGGVLISLT